MTAPELVIYDPILVRILMAATLELGLIYFQIYFRLLYLKTLQPGRFSQGVNQSKNESHSKIFEKRPRFER